MTGASQRDDLRLAELLLEHARDYAVFVLDLDGTIVGWSPGAERVTGFSEQEVRGRSFALLFLPSDRAAGEPTREVERAWEAGRAEDTRWHLRKSGERFWANGVTTAVRDGARPCLIKVMRDETLTRLAEEQRVLLLNELNHRINNTLATVQSITEQTLRAEGVAESVRDNLGRRLMALAAAHKTLVDQNWAGADLQALVERSVTPYRQPRSDRFSIDGPQLRLSPNQAVSMSLALHELMTNAVKYGALANEAGTVRIRWNMSIDEAGARNMTFLWEECGGPPVRPPTRTGFGSRLLARSFAEQGEDAVALDFAPEGLRCSIKLKLSSEREGEFMDLAQQQRAAPPI